MNAVFEYTLFMLVCAFVIREVGQTPTLLSEWRLELLRGHQAWLEYIDRARSEHTLGPPRLENRGGRLCVVGWGECDEVESLGAGLRLIASRSEAVAGLFVPT